MPGSNYRPENISKIFLLPNLMTAGNLIFGFLAILQIIQGTIEREKGGSDWSGYYVSSLVCILIACIFDLLDGRLARMSGKESPFGREFDSLADVVSFGVAPALLLFKIVLYTLPNHSGWLIAVLYLLCGALRLARFNIVATYNLGTGTHNFSGFPIPAAAGVISSITLVCLQYQSYSDLASGYAAYALAVLMIFLSFMMFSKVEYPSFKAFNWRTQLSLPKFLGVIALVGLNVVFYTWMPAVMFVSYLLYGFLRPFISRAWRKEIEEEETEEAATEEVPTEPKS